MQQEKHISCTGKKKKKTYVCTNQNPEIKDSQQAEPVKVIREAMPPKEESQGCEIPGEDGGISGEQCPKNTGSY